ncbi:MAG: hypothetical protein HWN65_03990 [Candidatus Helarchaeota archaeon]|nr:hypothetical protein [Candidatus Helarchaeota archaeon]
MPDKFEINLDKKEVKNTIDEIEQSDYYKRIAEQVKKVRTGEIHQAFKGNAEKWKNLFHTSALDSYDNLVVSILREDYQDYQKYIEPIKKLVGFHKLNLKNAIFKEKDTK